MLLHVPSARTEFASEGDLFSSRCTPGGDALALRRDIGLYREEWISSFDCFAKEGTLTWKCGVMLHQHRHAFTARFDYPVRQRPPLPIPSATCSLTPSHASPIPRHAMTFALTRNGWRGGRAQLSAALSAIIEGILARDTKAKTGYDGAGCFGDLYADDAVRSAGRNPGLSSR